ncbi:MAG: pre-protein VI [psittacine adenovirus 7]|uniref:Pre-protein VI n=1 Tax=psittacine adenovirus 7 TaxID=2848040 RepID=A0A6B9LIR1_9ADEN|nr:MAG: pre-protein VI [psittacine adenovirus 7]QHB43562.1 MAG: pre-protein VI [psittacine adenovirus 7]
MYSNLAPRLGQTSLPSYSIGTTELRGGKINWGSLGSSISNAFKTTGRFLGNTASKFVKSQAFQDIKQGLNDSGLVRNIAGLAGDTLSSLVDIGRLKLENELQNLRNRALNTIPADQLAQILANYQQTHDRITPPAAAEALPLPATTEIPVSRKRPIIEEVVDDDSVGAVNLPNVSVAPTFSSVSSLSLKRPRIRGTGELEWQRQLNNMLGQGVKFTSTNQCY